jgi:hypothetical protein
MPDHVPVRFSAGDGFVEPHAATSMAVMATRAEECLTKALFLALTA